MHPIRTSCPRLPAAMMMIRPGGRWPLLYAVCLLVLVNGCAMGAPRSGMGALFPTPDAALADALGPEGWLDEGLDRLVLHQFVGTREGTIVLYSGYAGDSMIAGSADAKRRDGQWYAHGMFRLPVPQLSGSQQVSCAIMQYQSSGISVEAVTGRVHRPAVSQILAVFDSGAEQPATMRDDAFMLLRPEGDRLRELRAIYGDEAIIEPIPAQDCRQ